MNILGKHINVKTILIHIVCWCLFFSLPALFNPRIYHINVEQIVYDALNSNRVYNNIYLLILFYISYWVAIPKLYFYNKNIGLMLYWVATLGIFVLINLYLIPHHPTHKEFLKHTNEVRGMCGPEMPHPHHLRRNNIFFLLGGPPYNLFMYFITCIASFTVSIYRRLQDMKNQQLKTEISFLKAQINPHFLFNTLNSIFSLTLSKSEQAPEAVLKISGIMRYTISEADKEWVSLEKEINYISNYIALQKLRLNSMVSLKYVVNGTGTETHIAPFLLIPFIENAFTYGISTEHECYIEVLIDIQAESIRMVVKNSIIPKQPSGGTGIGIATTKKRLALLYPEKHQLIIENKENEFLVDLQIALV